MPVIGFSGKPNVTSKDYDVFPLFPLDLTQLTDHFITIYRWSIYNQSLFSFDFRSAEALRDWIDQEGLKAQTSFLFKKI